jgi:hypothetical protein
MRWTAIVLMFLDVPRASSQDGLAFNLPALSFGPQAASPEAEEEGKGYFSGWKVPHSLYMSVSGGSFEWQKSSVSFHESDPWGEETSESNFRDGEGVCGVIGVRFMDYVSLQLDFGIFPHLFPETELFEDALGEDGGYIGLAPLLHFPIYRFLPYVGAGAGIMEVPDVSGTRIGFAPWVQGGILFFPFPFPVLEYFALSADVKYLWGFLDHSDDPTIGAVVYSFGVQVTLGSW